MSVNLERKFWSLQIYQKANDWKTTKFIFKIITDLYHFFVYSSTSPVRILSDTRWQQNSLNISKEFQSYLISAWNQRYTYRVLQTIQMKLILLCVWAERAILGSAKTALKFTVSYLWLYGIPALPSEYRNTPQEISQAADGRSKGLILQFLTVYLEAVPLILLWCQNYLMRITVNETHKKEMC